MNYEFCSEKLSMLEILFYGRNKPASVLTKIAVQSRDDMEQMTIQMDVHTYKTFKTKAQQVHLDFLDRDILSGNNNNTITNTLNKDEYNIKEETSIDLNVILASLFGALSTVAVVLVGVRYRQARDGNTLTDLKKGSENQSKGIFNELDME
ncbi:Hypothetical predicted protein [Mytilus galloprovincialis]|nr:Hypothetical predicted protein [Mytilus galloprovincialis]